MKFPAREHELKQFLASLPSDKAMQLALAVERGRLGGDRGLPADLILDGLRPTLRRLGMRRTPSALRLFCEPFADFLVDGREFKQAGRIARTSLLALWNWLSKEGMRTSLPALEQQIARAVLARDTRRETELVHQMQAEAVTAMRTALERARASSTDRRILGARMGGEEAILDAEEMLVLLAASVDLSPLRGLLPRRIDSLAEQHTHLVRDIYEDLSGRRPDLCPYVGLLVLGRLRRPWEVLRLSGLTSSDGRGPLFRPADIGLIGDILLADMENLALDIASVRPDTLDPETLLDRLDRFTQMSGGLVREIGPKRDGKWGQRLIKIRHLASDAMEALIGRAPREIMAALPVLRLGAFGGRSPRRPDLAREPDNARIDRALVWARLLAGATPYAGSGDFHGVHRDAFEEVSNFLISYTDSILAELKAMEADRRPRAQAYLAHAEALSTTILGDEETEQMRRRVAAALGR